MKSLLLQGRWGAAEAEGVPQWPLCRSLALAGARAGIRLSHAIAHRPRVTVRGNVSRSRTIFSPQTRCGIKKGTVKERSWQSQLRAALSLSLFWDIHLLDECFSANERCVKSGFAP